MGKQVDHNSFWLIRQNPITKIGVFPYLGRQISEDLEPSKIYQVLRPESELFAKESLESFNGLPITIGHALLGPKTEGFTPAEDKGVDGTTGTTAERKGDKVVNDIKLFSERIKDEVNNGKKELSADISATLCRKRVYGMAALTILCSAISAGTTLPW